MQEEVEEGSKSLAAHSHVRQHSEAENEEGCII